MATSSPPLTQTAAWLDQTGPDAHIRIRHDIPTPVPRKGEVLIKIHCTGVCHSDLHNIRGISPVQTHIQGHEGIGEIISLGPASPEKLNHLIGRRAGVKWLYSYCNACEICAVDVTACPNQHNAGRDVAGTFQQYIAAPVEGLTLIPDGLRDEIAAPLMCAGVSMKDSIARAELKNEDWLVILGAGGGLGHLGVQIARETGIRVIAVDSGNEKRALCLTSGALHFVDFKEVDVVGEVKKLTGGYGAHAVVCLPGPKSYEQALQMLRNKGTLVCVGLVKENLPISPFDMIVRGKWSSQDIPPPKVLNTLSA